MAYTETTTTSWGSRLGGSFKGIFIGLGLVAAGTAVLWWNEGSFVETRDALNETQGITEELGDISTVNAAMNGKVVHASGKATTKDVLRDPIFGVAQTAIRLTTDVEYYQWVENVKTEKRQKLGGGEETVKTYTYELKWTGSAVNSSNFKDPQARRVNANKVKINVKPETQYAKNVTFGAYRLPESMIRSISGATTFDVVPEKQLVEKLDKALRPVNPTLNQAAVQTLGNAVQTLGQAVSTATNGAVAPVANPVSNVHVSGSTIYVGPNPASPELGDVRVSYKAVYPADISIIARLNGNTFEPVHASNGKTISKLTMGTVSQEAMFKSAHSGNSMMTWLVRAFGAALIICGFKMVFAPLSVLASVIPMLGSIVGAGSGFIATMLGGAWSLIVMSIAWLAFRPLIGCAMLAVALALIALLFIRGRKAKAAAPAA